MLNANWQEIDEPSQIWTIPVERMKAGREHRVPLSNAAMSLLSVLKKQQRGDLIFPGQKRNQPTIKYDHVKSTATIGTRLHTARVSINIQNMDL